MLRAFSLLRAATIAGGLCALPFTLSGSSGDVTFNDAVCEKAGGTCCPQNGSTCYPNGCNNGICSQDNAYWKSEGRCP